ncbi:hypothetical protein C8J57DRAFT_1512599 [Mycena rebaudengoi]|nr:hypothetical protein C8J57DRAFT_1512599 [Mycena rebaudengoi]
MSTRLLIRAVLLLLRSCAYSYTCAWCWRLTRTPSLPSVLVHVVMSCEGIKPRGGRFEYVRAVALPRGAGCDALTRPSVTPSVWPYAVLRASLVCLVQAGVQRARRTSCRNRGFVYLRCCALALPRGVLALTLPRTASWCCRSRVSSAASCEEMKARESITAGGFHAAALPRDALALACGAGKIRFTRVTWRGWDACAVSTAARARSDMSCIARGYSVLCFWFKTMVLPLMHSK